MSYPMALIERRFNVRLQKMPRGEFLAEEGLCIFAAYINHINHMIRYIKEV